MKTIKHFFVALAATISMTTFAAVEEEELSCEVLFDALVTAQQESMELQKTTRLLEKLDISDKEIKEAAIKYLASIDEALKKFRYFLTRKDCLLDPKLGSVDNAIKWVDAVKRLIPLLEQEISSLKSKYNI